MSLPLQDITEIAKAAGAIIPSLAIGYEAYKKIKGSKKKRTKRKRRPPKVVPDPSL